MEWNGEYNKTNLFVSYNFGIVVFYCELDKPEFVSENEGEDDTDGNSVQFVSVLTDLLAELTE
jgi:hypothetical protein